MEQYNNLEEWKNDMEIFKDNPNDKKFLNHIAKKVKVSDENLQSAIKEKVAEDLFERDPVAYMTFLSDTFEDKHPVINTKEDIWFKV